LSGQSQMWALSECLKKRSSWQKNWTLKK